jgi:hypothetical protein
MKQKVIQLSGNKRELFIKVIASHFNVTADMELKLIGLLLHYELTGAFHLSKSWRERLCRDMGITENGIKVPLSRLVHKNVLIRSVKTYQLNPSFVNLDDIDAVCYRYVEKEKEN